MKLSAPVYHLKRKARFLARKDDIPLHQALDRIAVEEGFKAWSLLSAKAAPTGGADRIFAQLVPGDLMLLGARPGHGKTLMSLELAGEAMRSGSRSVFFTLEYTERDVIDRFRMLGVNRAQLADRFGFDDSDTISASHIIDRLQLAPRGTLIVVDYLQLLDQRRENPPLMEQVRALKSFAHDRGLIIIFISQIDRSYDPSKKPQGFCRCPVAEPAGSRPVHQDMLPSRRRSQVSGGRLALRLGCNCAAGGVRRPQFAA